MRLTATAAPTPAPMLPDTLPASESISEDWRALMVSWLVVARPEPVQYAVISSSSRLVVLEPLMLAVPLTPTATPIDSITEVE